LKTGYGKKGKKMRGTKETIWKLKWPYEEGGLKSTKKGPENVGRR